jgi:mRNA interferase RelE/StbE
LPDYRIFETEQFATDLRRLAKAGHGRLIDKLRGTVYPQLARHPHFGPNVKKLRSYEPETWRYRIGAWRFFYEIDEAEHVVLLTAAAHRGSAY